jgi:hypothetical protein
MMRSVALALFISLLALLAPPAHAVEIRISAAALERTLNQQLFNGPDGRYYFRGKAAEGCYAYASDPKVSFKDDRIVVHVKSQAKLGAKMGHNCLGIDFKTEADVSVVPEAQGEFLGFRDARIEKLSNNKDLDFLLVPFLSGKLPQKMRVNVADMLRKLVQTSTQSTGYNIQLTNLKVLSMQVEGDVLVVDFDPNLTVQ